MPVIFLSTSQNPKRIFALAGAIYVLFTFLAFGSLSQHQFELDDLAYLVDLGQIRHHPDLIFSPDRHLPGRPVTDLALLSIQTLFGNDPAAFHLAVVFCHFLTTLLLTLPFYKMGLNSARTFPVNNKKAKATRYFENAQPKTNEKGPTPCPQNTPTSSGFSPTSTAPRPSVAPVIPTSLHPPLTK